MADMVRAEVVEAALAVAYMAVIAGPALVTVATFDWVVRAAQRAWKGGR